MMKFSEIEKDTNAPVKVAFVLPSLAAGGAERVLITVMNNLDRTKFDPCMIVANNVGELHDLIDREIPVHSLGHYAQVAKSIPALIWRLRKVKPDVVVSTMAHMNYAVLLAKPFLKKGTRIIVREAITPSFIVESVKKGWLAKLLYKWLYPKADLVISPAQMIIDEFHDYLHMDISNHALLYNPVNIDKIRAVPQILQSIDETRENTVHFACAGRLHYQKGFDRLIEALRWFKPDFDWRLSILGEGDEFENLQELIKSENLSGAITLAGFEKNPWPKIGAADYFLLPSRSEGLPNVVLESLSVGTPVIAHNQAGGIDEIAKLAGSENVKVLATMPEFIDTMRSVSANPTRLYRQSLLPPTFRLETVMKRFSDMLEGKGEFSKAIIETAKRRRRKKKAA